MRTQQAVLPILHQRIFADIRQIAANQREVMIAIGLTNVADAFQRRLIANVTSQGIAGIGRINDYGAAAQRRHRLTHVAQLRGYGVQLQVDAHGVGYDTRMNQLLEWLPLLVFFIAFKALDIYWATSALMIACVLQLVIHRVSTGRFKTMHIITTGVVMSLGTATLLLHDKRFIQWKPTVLLGLTSIAFLASLGVGKQPLVRRLFDSVFEQPLAISARGWRAINLLWVLWFALLAMLNIYVARNFAESVWVNYKVFGLPVATMIFLIPQVIWMSGKALPAKVDSSAPADTAAVHLPAAAARAQQLRSRLENRFAPAQLSIEDESALHEGHAGAAGGQSHFRVRIVSEAFRGISAVARHRLIYAAVDDLMNTDIHALAIEASAPAET